MVSPQLLVPMRPLVYVLHCAPSGVVKVRLSGSDNVAWFETRDEALAFARKIGGEGARIFEQAVREKRKDAK